MNLTLVFSLCAGSCFPRHPKLSCRAGECTAFFRPYRQTPCTASVSASPPLSRSRLFSCSESLLHCAAPGGLAVIVPVREEWHSMENICSLLWHSHRSFKENTVWKLTSQNRPIARQRPAVSDSWTYWGLRALSPLAYRWYRCYAAECLAWNLLESALPPGLPCSHNALLSLAGWKPGPYPFHFFCLYSVTDRPSHVGWRMSSFLPLLTSPVVGSEPFFPAHLVQSLARLGFQFLTLL